MDQDQSRRRPPRPLSELRDELLPARAELAQELRKGRDKANMSLSELAGLTFSSKASISRWLNGQAMPTKDQAESWAVHCDTDVATMLRRWETATTDSSPDDVPTVGEQESAPAYPGRRRRRGLVLAVAAALVVAVAVLTVVLTRRSADCAATFPINLEMPTQTGGSFGATIGASCDMAADRTYLLTEELPDVDPRNPQPAYYMKARFPTLRAGGNTSVQLLIKEAIGTRAEFYVVSVDSTDLRALGQNHIVDDGVLELPPGTRQESTVVWHTRGWK